jgi:hypothetical protein
MSIEHGGNFMNRLVPVAALILAGVVAAQADMSRYTNMLKQPRSNDVLHADARACDWQVGRDLNGVPTTAAYKRCMRGRGWRYDYTRVEKAWVDPDTGLTCHPILGGFGSACSNF